VEYSKKFRIGKWLPRLALLNVFDQYIPNSTDVSLKKIIKRNTAQRLRKTSFAKILDKAGYQDLALKIRNDESY
jgi:hypothetical protein